MKTVRLVGKCPVCSEAVQFSRRACSRCDALHHEECWNYNRGCGIYGCQARPAAMPARPGSSAIPVEVPRYLNQLWVISVLSLNAGIVLIALLRHGGL